MITGPVVQSNANRRRFLVTKLVSSAVKKINKERGESIMKMFAHTGFLLVKDGWLRDCGIYMQKC